MVATSHPIATQIGIDILQDGGNAIDAAIAANAALGLMEPTGSGIGGDLFAIVWIEKDKKLYGLNASGRSPKDLTIEYFTENNYKKIPAYGPLPVSVPGCVDGWFELHDRFGKLKMNQVKFGLMVKMLRVKRCKKEIVQWFISSLLIIQILQFLKILTGDLIIQKDLAEVLKAIAAKGRKGFYEGEVARKIVEDLI